MSYNQYKRSPQAYGPNPGAKQPLAPNPPDLKKIESLLVGGLSSQSLDLKAPLELDNEKGAPVEASLNVSHANHLLGANSTMIGFKKPGALREEAAVPAPIYDPGLYNDAYSRLGLMRLANICDLGCGSGPFTGVMIKRNQKPEVYLGVDNSHAQISSAKAAYPGWSFIYGDFMEPKVWEQCERYDAFLLLNIMDVIEGDLELLELLPSGKQCLFSLPKNEKPGSRRYFPDFLTLKERYGGYVNIRSIGSFRGQEALYHMVVGERW
ncbi:MAG: class I SAM-dependent methyltransferase [Deltaproteobacteria bacterium]|nr:class I SAM-dependent methyltransferase [Deltaproteobacteria bacterium]